jgi:hypothetical protein
VFPFPGPLPAAFREQFRFRPRRQHRARDLEFEAAENRRPQNVLERFPVAAPADVLPHRGQLGLSKLAFELQIQLQPRNLQHARQHQLDLQARRFHAPFFQEFRASLDHLEQAHAAK